MHTTLKLAILCFCTICNTLCAQNASSPRQTVETPATASIVQGEKLRTTINAEIAKGRLALEKGKINGAIFHFQQAQELAQGQYPQLRLESHGLLADLYLQNANYEAAYRELENANHLMQKASPPLARSSRTYLHRLRGALMDEVGLDTLAMTALESAYANAQFVRDTFQLIQIRLAQAGFWRKRNEFQAAQNAYEQGLTEATKLHYPALRATSFLGLGELEYLQQNRVNAKSYFEKALQLAQSAKRSQLIADASTQLGVIALDNNQFDIALEYCDRAYDLAVSKSLRQIQLESCDCLREAHERQGHWETALILLKDYNRLELEANEEQVRRSVSAQRFQEKLQNIAIEQAAERDRLLSVQERTQQDLLNERRHNRLLAYFLSTALVFAGAIYWFYRRNRQKNHELNRLNKQLYSTNAQLAVANETLAENNQALDRFAAVAAHDLKGPLRSIQSFSSLLAKLLGDRAKAQEQECLNFISSSSDRLAILLDDLLSFSRLGKQMEAPKPVDLETTVAAVMENLHQDIEQKQATISFAGLPTVLAKDSLMVLLFQNLISNSLKFTKAETAPQIQIRSENTSNNRTRISVQDNGIGIPETHQEKVFELFTRLHSTQTFEGSGVGLATCRKIVQHYDGTIGIESKEEEGTTVWLELPLAQGISTN